MIFIYLFFMGEDNDPVPVHGHRNNGHGGHEGCRARECFNHSEMTGSSTYGKEKQAT